MNTAGDKLRSDLSSVTPVVTERALKQLTFSDLVPPELARATLEQRMSDPAGALSALMQPIATAV